MPNLMPDAVWEDVYQIEPTDRVLGGVGGVSNLQAQSLVNQNLYARKHGGALPYLPGLTYDTGDRVKLTAGVIVSSTIDGNTADPNSDMTGWVKTNDANQIFAQDGTTLQKTSERVVIIDDRAEFVEDYSPAYNGSLLSSRYSTLAEAQQDYPSAYSLSQSIDTAAIQEAVNAASGRRVVVKEGAEYTLTAINPSPDTSAGNYSILVQNPVNFVKEGSKNAKFFVPANQHGLIVVSDDFELDGINFEGVGAVGTIGHHIKLYNSKNPRIKNATFKNVSDAGICFQTNLNDVLTNFDDPLYDMFSTGCKNIYTENITILDANGDAGIEIQGASGGTLRGNKFYNQKGHGIRCVGNKGLRLEKNYGENIGASPGAFAAFISCFSGAISPVGKDPRPFYNSDITVTDNEGKNVLDYFHIGIGAEDIYFNNNRGTCTQRTIHLLNSGSVIGRWGAKNSFFTGNVIRGASQWLSLQVSTTAPPPSTAPLADNLVFQDNNFGITGAVNGVVTIAQTADQPIQNSTLNRNTVNATTPPTDLNTTAIVFTHVKDSDLSGNLTNFDNSNGREMTVFTPAGTLKYGKRDKVMFDRSGNNIVLRSRNELRRGRRVTFTTTGTLPGGLTVNTIYYLATDDSLIFAVNTDLTAAMSGTGITLTSAGTGNHFMNLV